MGKKSKLSLNKAKLKNKKHLNCAQAKKKGFFLFGTRRQAKKNQKRNVVFVGKAVWVFLLIMSGNKKKSELSLDKAILDWKTVTLCTKKKKNVFFSFPKRKEKQKKKRQQKQKKKLYFSEMLEKALLHIHRPPMYSEVHFHVSYLPSLWDFN